ncbi:MAG: UrcA family protein [Sphingomicrobium sp.]
MLKPLTAFAALVTATALVAPTVSHAAAADSVPVSYADLNLATAKGQQVLGRRIAVAATVVCDTSTRTRDYRIETAGKVCRTGAIERVQPALLAAIAGARRGTVTVLDAAALVVTAK